MTILRFALFVLLLVTPARADQADDLFEALRLSNSETDARLLENEIWQYWLRGPNDAATRFVARAMERRRWHDYAGALEFLDKAVAAAPDWSEAWNQRAFIHFLREHYDKSLEDLDRALELEPRHFGALAGKARILMRQGRMALGQDALRKAVKIHPFLRERSMLIEIPGQDL